METIIINPGLQEITFQKMAEVNLPKFHNEVDKIVIIDLRFCNYIDSSFVGYLLLIKQNLERDKNILYIKNAGERVRNTFRLMRLDEWFTDNWYENKEQ